MTRRKRYRFSKRLKQTAAMSKLIGGKEKIKKAVRQKDRLLGRGVLGQAIAIWAASAKRKNETLNKEGAKRMDLN